MIEAFDVYLLLLTISLAVVGVCVDNYLVSNDKYESENYYGENGCFDWIVRGFINYAVKLNDCRIYPIKLFIMLTTRVILVVLVIRLLLHISGWSTTMFNL